MKFIVRITFFFCLLFYISFAASAQFMADAEFNILSTGYNKIQVSGTEGTRFNVVEGGNGEFDNPTSLTLRLRAGYRFKNRHNVFGLFAPLQISYNGSFDRNTRFFEKDFLPLIDTKVNYQFNSYRLTYRYDFVVTDKVRLGAGLTGKIRDAYIEVEQNGLSSKKTNIGFVPLINLYAAVNLNEKIGLMVEGDGLASPQGRAFDFELAAFYRITENINLRFGYRILEGGAENDEVYNFTLVNYGLMGMNYNF
ncbi:hypothetical protein WAF17_13905 [Bernardetia sp. ABR2-2B]|uniref:hypothetical protein n=1 Tax=Bernardetia sp. ABR2-2B TaxID=3127472 RepID=UPI0030D0B03E